MDFALKLGMNFESSYANMYFILQFKSDGDVNVPLLWTSHYHSSHVEISSISDIIDRNIMCTLNINLHIINKMNKKKERVGRYYEKMKESMRRY